LYYSLSKRNKKAKVIIFLLFAVFMPVVLWLPAIYMRGLYIFMHTGIFLIIVFEFMLYIEKQKALNLFYIILIAYELSVIYKLVARTLDLNNGVILFYLTSFVEIIFGILFAFININTKDFRIFKNLQEPGLK